MKRFTAVITAVALLSLLIAPAAIALEDWEEEPSLYAPHTEPVIKSVFITQPDPFAPPTAFAFIAHCDTGLGYDNPTMAYGNTYNGNLWMNNKISKVWASAGSLVKTATFSAPLYAFNAVPYASDAAADYFRIQIKLAHHDANGAHSINTYGYYYYSVLKPVVTETCPCGAAVERDASGCVYAVGGDTNIETISDHMCYCGLEYQK